MAGRFSDGTWFSGRSWAAAAVLALVSPLALGQGAPTRLRGAIEQLDGQVLAVTSREGPSVKVKLADTVRISAVKAAKLSDIKPGSYVGAAAMTRSDGTLMALEVLIFPEAMRGAGEGHRPWDLMPDSTMTNATVAETVGSVNGQALTLTYKDGQKTLIVPQEAPIVTFVPADRGDLKPGTKIFASVTKAEDGTTTAGNLVVGRDGVDPPM